MQTSFKSLWKFWNHLKIDMVATETVAHWWQVMWKFPEKTPKTISQSSFWIFWEDQSGWLFGLLLLREYLLPYHVFLKKKCLLGSRFFLLKMIDLKTKIFLVFMHLLPQCTFVCLNLERKGLGFKRYLHPEAIHGNMKNKILLIIAWRVTKYGVFSGSNVGKYGPEKTAYLDTFHAVYLFKTMSIKYWQFYLENQICEV